MTYLLLQTFLLLLSSYFLGAFLACLVKRMTTRRAVRAAAIAPRVAAAPVLRPAASLSPAKPRSIDPVQPKIDILPRPEPKAAPAQTALDTSRFDRALTGPDPNAGMPRKSIVEIRPAILKAPTVASEPVRPKPQPAPVQAAPQPKPAPVQAAPAKPAPAPAPAATVTSVPSTVQSQPGGAASASAAASAAAAAAVAAAKAAAANAATAVVKPAPAPSPTQVGKAPEPQRPAVTSAPAAQISPAPAPAPVQPAAPQPVLGGDDLQRIRAIDADTERRLQGINVRRFDDIARWTPADINRVNQALGLTGRIDREQWIEQAQILAKGGETYYSRNRAAAARGPAQAAAPAQVQATVPQPAPAVPTAQQTVAAAAAAAAAAATAPKTVSAAPAAPAPSAPQPAAPPNTQQGLPQGRSVAEMAAAAAAAIAAASASVTRGIRPIEPISPMSRANPNISMPAKLSDAIKDKEVKAAPAPAAPTSAAVASKETASAKPVSPDAGGDDLKRIRGIGILIEKRLNAAGVTTYNSIANWTSGDIDRISQTLDFKGRIERENWVEQARILSSGGHTEFSRRVDRGDVETSKE
jgi:predicted flap endonuclease-1-like 5' DNA nuclease